MVLLNFRMEGPRQGIQHVVGVATAGADLVGHGVAEDEAASEGERVRDLFPEARRLLAHAKLGTPIWYPVRKGGGRGASGFLCRCRTACGAFGPRRLSRGCRAVWCKHAVLASFPIIDADNSPCYKINYSSDR